MMDGMKMDGMKMDEMTDESTKPPKKAEPFGGTPKDTQPTPAAPDDAANMVADAKAAGKLAPIEEVMKEQGWDMDPGTALLLAQKKQAPGTQGKSPDELAQMLRDDPSVYEDLKALQPGGTLDTLEKEGTSAMKEKAAAKPADEKSDPKMDFFAGG